MKYYWFVNENTVYRSVARPATAPSPPPNLSFPFITMSKKLERFFFGLRKGTTLWGDGENRNRRGLTIFDRLEWNGMESTDLPLHLPPYRHKKKDQLQILLFEWIQTMIDLIGTKKLKQTSKDPLILRIP